MTRKYAQEAIKPYNSTEPKDKQVEEMFDSIAPKYDLLNHLLSVGIDRKWRRKAIDTLADAHPKTILDIATGTGDFAILAAKRLKPERLVGIDLSQNMLDVAQKKVAAEGLNNIISLEQGDCLALNYADETFNAAMVAFGARNFSDLELGLSEIYRVLQKNGRLVVLELTSPKHFPMKQLFWLYSHLYMPLLGRLLSKDTRAYHYLPATMEVFPQGEVMSQILASLGYRYITYKRLTFGLCTLYTAAR